ncbi:FAD-binding domain-containing protein [Auriculariales sp. MPI-PUGE-AT-0066]|nr:FAD-binding domain-containing protein [Auriculariales sp. MPI-PUGE-AT-0066]
MFHLVLVVAFIDLFCSYNRAYEYWPAALVRPNDTAGVAAAVMCAVKTNVKVQPRCGGHSFADYSIGGQDGSLVVDLKQLQKYEIDSTTWQAKVGGGTLLGDLTKRMHESGGRAMAHGTCPQVGLGGHATIGGLGPTSRQFGAALDHIVEVEVVLANGTVTRANEQNNSDLFFAIRGAASSFGIVTEFVVKTEPEPAQVVEYSYNFILGSPKNGANTFKSWQKFISNPNLDRRLASQLTVTQFAMIVSGSFFGTEDEFRATGFDAALNSTGKVSVAKDWLGTVLHWAEGEFLSAIGGIPAPFYSKSLDFRNDTLMSDATVDALFNYMDVTDKGTLIWTAIFDLEGGAINDVPADATAYGHRDALYYIQTYGIGLTGLSSKTTAFLNGIDSLVRKAMPKVDFGAYAGYVDPQLGDDAQRQYFKGNLPRLQQLKAKYDPSEVYWNPQSIKPVAA